MHFLHVKLTLLVAATAASFISLRHLDIWLQRCDCVRNRTLANILRCTIITTGVALIAYDVYVAHQLLASISYATKTSDMRADEAPRSTKEEIR